MTGFRRLAPLVASISLLTPSAAHGQLGEVHVGSLVSYGPTAPYGVGGGLVLGVAAGRLAYAGLRWVYQTGSSEPATTPTASVDVRSRVQLFAVDLGFQLPVGPFEVVPGVALGVALFTQRAGGATTSDEATEFFGAPGLAVQARVAGLRVIPEIQYYLPGHPDLPWQVAHRGWVSSLRVVIPFEVDRIRY